MAFYSVHSGGLRLDRCFLLCKRWMRTLKERFSSKNCLIFAEGARRAESGQTAGWRAAAKEPPVFIKTPRALYGTWRACVAGKGVGMQRAFCIRASASPRGQLDTGGNHDRFLSKIDKRAFASIFSEIHNSVIELVCLPFPASPVLSFSLWAFQIFNRRQERHAGRCATKSATE